MAYSEAEKKFPAKGFFFLFFCFFNSKWEWGKLDGPNDF